MTIFKYCKVLFLLICILFQTLLFSQGTKFKVVLDAGHGAHDPGTKHFGHVEKKINLAIVLKAGKILEENPYIDVIYTRKTDVFIDLVERADIANRANANIFISVHCDALPSKSEANGYQTFVMGIDKNAKNLEVSKRENAVISLEKNYKQNYAGFDPNNPGSILGATLVQEEYMENSIVLASKIQDKFSKDETRKNRGVSPAPFMVLHKASMPRVLVETGFISNPKEGAYLDSEEGQDVIAQAIADAVISYKTEYFGLGYNDQPEQENTSEKPIKTDEKPTKTETNYENQDIIFKVQISATNKKVDLKPKNFKGLKNVTMVSDSGKIYKYMYGSTADYQTAKKNLSEAKAKGFSSAYLLAFKDGKKIDVKDAIK